MENKDVCSHMTIVNRDMILMLNGLTNGTGVTIGDKNGDKVINIPKGIFEEKANYLLNELLTDEKLDPTKSVNLLDQIIRINECLGSGTNTFTVDDPGESPRDGTKNFSIIITPNATGGRRSKTYRTKKGKRKTRRRQRGHRRS